MGKVLGWFIFVPFSVMKHGGKRNKFMKPRRSPLISLYIGRTWYMLYGESCRYVYGGPENVCKTCHIALYSWSERGRYLKSADFCLCCIGKIVGTCMEARKCMQNLPYSPIQLIWAWQVPQVGRFRCMLYGESCRYVDGGPENVCKTCRIALYSSSERGRYLK